MSPLDLEQDVVMQDPEEPELPPPPSPYVYRGRLPTPRVTASPPSSEGVEDVEVGAKGQSRNKIRKINNVPDWMSTPLDLTTNLGKPDTEGHGTSFVEIANTIVRHDPILAALARELVNDTEFSSPPTQSLAYQLCRHWASPEATPEVASAVVPLSKLFDRLQGGAWTYVSCRFVVVGCSVEQSLVGDRD
jgi:hypothetical protein